MKATWRGTTIAESDDTIVVVLSDHGDMLGSQGLRLKRKPWEYPRV